jgi:hypothetical protein
MQRLQGLLLCLLAISLLVGVGQHVPVYAAATSTPPPATKKVKGGITISPAFQQITLGQNDTEKSFDFAVTNNTSEPYELALASVDFGSLDESGGVLFIGQSDKSLDYKYGLSQDITLQQDRVVVEPKATTKIPVTITNKESMTPGGHYGAILVTPTSAGEGSRKVEVNQVISSLLFVTKQGGAIYQLGLQSFQLKTHLFSSPSDVDVRFQNAGNVHIIPRGLITITDPRGRIVKRGYVNDGSGIMLPETFRKFNVPLKSLTPAWWPGIYHMTLTYHFDGETVEHTKELTFTYVNGWYIVAIMAIFAVIILAIISKHFRRLLSKIWGYISLPFRRSFGWLKMRFKRA